MPQPKTVAGVRVGNNSAKNYNREERETRREREAEHEAKDIEELFMVG